MTVADTKIGVRVDGVSKRYMHRVKGEHYAARDVQMMGYKEPSLAFYQGGTIREQSENDFLIKHPQSEWPKWLVIRQDLWDKTPAEIQQRSGHEPGVHLWQIDRQPVSRSRRCVFGRWPFNYELENTDRHSQLS